MMQPLTQVWTWQKEARRWFRRRYIHPYKPATIRGRFLMIGVMMLAVGSVLCVSAFAYHYVAGLARDKIVEHSQPSLDALADAMLYLERHRRVIKGIASLTDSDERAKLQHQAETLLAKLEAVSARDDVLAVASLQVDVAELRRLSQQTNRVSRQRGHPDQHQVAASGSYAMTAERLQGKLLGARKDLQQEVSRLLNGMLRIGNIFAAVFVASVFFACAFVLPLSWRIGTDMVRRLEAINAGMHKLVQGKTQFDLPRITETDEIGEMSRALGVFRENAITLISNDEEIKRLNMWFDIALNNMSRGLSMFDADRRMTVCNRQYRDMYGLPPELSVPGTPFEDIVAYWLWQPSQAMLGSELPGWLKRLECNLANGETFSELRTVNDGRTFKVQFQPLPDGGWVDLHEDVTQAQLAQKRIAHLAQHDALTGLENRSAFSDKLRAALAELQAEQAFAVLWLDLDMFKEVNDTMGHPVGDLVLKVVADRLRRAVRDTDRVARLGGDEFAIMLAPTGSCEIGAISLAERLLKVIAEPIIFKGQRIQLGVSIGIAIAPLHGRSPEVLMKNADLALYQSKGHGRGRCEIFARSLEDQANKRRALETDLRQALRNNQLALHYQPIIALDSGRVVACEALMRWRHPQRGNVSPGVFIPVAEDIGLIAELGAWAMEQACRDALTWPEEVRVAVNLSPHQFTRSNLVKLTEDTLAKTGLPGERLELEVTEGLLIRDDVKTIETLRALRQMGVGVALDDFGTGYASLAYLRKYPFSRIKIDQTFVRDLPDNPQSEAIVRTVVQLARLLGMVTIAEGVETQQHLDKIRDAGCSEVQGYYFSRPVPADAVLDAMAAATGQCRSAA